jgi:hypothetical protein
VVTEYQKILINDLSGPNSYGTPLVGWKRQIAFFNNANAPVQLGALRPDLASTFVEDVYFLLRTNRMVRVYRGFEVAGLKAPFGVDTRASFRVCWHSVNRVRQTAFGGRPLDQVWR